MLPPPDAMPLHLMLSLVKSLSFPGASPSWNNAWPNFNPLNAMQNPFASLPNPLEASANQWLQTWQSLSDAANAQSNQFFDGVRAYTEAEYVREESDYAVIWQSGSARLLDYAPDAADAVAVLCIPSLINKYYILDLYKQTSLVQFLKRQGFRPLVLDWGTPDTNELEFTTSDYITAYALDALRELRELHDAPIAVLGYCMGGIFAVALAQLAPLFVDALVLLATPWDFSAEDTPRILLEPSSQLLLRQWIHSMNPVPPVVTQTIFHLIDPWRVQEKYRDFLTLHGDERKHFLAIEHWVNDGVALPQKTAEECFVDWPQGNILATHQWKVGRRWIDPSTIACPTLAVIPQHDKIVPMGVAKPLTKALKRCDTFFPDAGHVSMVAGKRAPEVLWKPLAGWLHAKF